MSLVLMGKVTGLRKGEKKESGKRYDTLRVEVGDKTYYPKFDSEMMKPIRDNGITLVCDVKPSNNGKSLSLFVAGHVQDEMLIDPIAYQERNNSFDDWD